MGRINAGQLTERITLFAPAASVADGAGGWLPAGAETGQSLWARMRPLRQAEKLRYGLLATTTAYEATIRRLDSLTASQRLEHAQRSYAIQAIVPDEAREYLLLTCYDSGG